MFPEEDAATGILTAKDKMDQVFVDFSTKRLPGDPTMRFLMFYQKPS